MVLLRNLHRHYLLGIHPRIEGILVAVGIQSPVVVLLLGNLGNLVVAVDSLDSLVVAVGSLGNLVVVVGSLGSLVVVGNQGILVVAVGNQGTQLVGNLGIHCHN